jgi:hypothetical protein
MEEAVARFVGNLIGRLHGPLTFRLLLQPTMAAILAVRSGYADARAGRPAYLWAMFRHGAERGRLAREGWRAVVSVFTVAVLVDAVYQLLVFQWFYPGEAVAVAAILAFVPYVVIRGPANRIACLVEQRSKRERRGHAKT